MIEVNQSLQMFVVFRLHEGSYGLPLENISEVVRMVAITSVPRAPEWLLGVINVRGRVVPIIDLRLRLGLPPRTAELNTPVIVVQVKDRVVGLVVDRTEEVISLPPEAITPPDDLTVRARPVQAVANRNGELILILDLPRVAAGTEHFSTEPMPKGKHEPSKSKA